MTTKINYVETPRFQKDFKKLKKKFKSLPKDLKLAKKNAIELCHLHRTDNQSVFPIPDFYDQQVKIYKLKKFRCQTLKGKGVKSGIRITYAYHPDNKVVLIEIYFKGDKENEDKNRIKQYLKSIKL